MSNDGVEARDVDTALEHGHAHGRLQQCGELLLRGGRERRHGGRDRDLGLVDTRREQRVRQLKAGDVRDRGEEVRGRDRQHGRCGQRVRLLAGRLDVLGGVLLGGESGGGALLGGVGVHAQRLG